MSQIISFKVLWEKFQSLDKFTKIAIVIIFVCLFIFLALVILVISRKQILMPPVQVSPTPTSPQEVSPTPTLIPTGSALPALAAFFGAEGWGAASVGGRGGRVIEVTNLNDTGIGSLRYCVQESSGPRICVFRVGGVITLQSEITIRNPFITIAGQTAPGDGITLIGSGTSRRPGIRVLTNDVIIQYLHYRGGSITFISIRPWRDAHNVIIDHCSASGGQDDTMEAWWNDANTIPGPDPDIRNITFQNCLIAEADAGHPTAMLFGGSFDLSVSPPILDYERTNHISVHNNYFAHNGHRNPLIKSKYTEVINNVVYNWHNRIGGTGFSSEADFINNYWKKGPMSGNRALVFEWLDSSCRPFPLSSNYIAGNIIPSKGVIDSNQDNWFLFETNEGYPGCKDVGNPVPETNRRFTPLQPAPIPVTIKSALTTVDALLADVGANKRLNSDGSFTNNQDSADQKFIDNFYAGSGPTSPPTSVTMPSSIDPGTPYTDTDKDGMADDWENLHFATLSRGSSSDSSSDFDGDGYTDLEEFLNGSDPTSGAPSPPPITPPTTPPPPTGPDTTPPVISNIQPQGALPASTKEVTITLETNETARCGISQNPSVIGQPDAKFFTITGGTSHSITLPEVEKGKSYTLYARCKDEAGNITPEDTVIQFSIAKSEKASPLSRLLPIAIISVVGIGVIFFIVRRLRKKRDSIV